MDRKKMHFSLLSNDKVGGEKRRGDELRKEERGKRRGEEEGSHALCCEQFLERTQWLLLLLE